LNFLYLIFDNNSIVNCLGFKGKKAQSDAGKDPQRKTIKTIQVAELN